MKCLETRKRDGMKWRRYRTPDGRTVTTYELPCEVLRGAAPSSKLKERLSKWENGQRLEARRARARELLSAGWKPVAIANEIGVTTRTVERMKC